MIYAEALPGDVLRLHNDDGTEEHVKVENLSPEIREKFLLLRAADPGTRIPKVGWHMKQDTYWIFESEDDDKEDNVQIQVKRLHMLLNSTINYQFTGY